MQFLAIKVFSKHLILPSLFQDGCQSLTMAPRCGRGYLKPTQIKKSTILFGRLVASRKQANRMPVLLLDLLLITSLALKLRRFCHKHTNRQLKSLTTRRSGRERQERSSHVHSQANTHSRTNL
jgi:hypothetical protein